MMMMITTTTIITAKIRQGREQTDEEDERMTIVKLVAHMEKEEGRRSSE